MKNKKYVFLSILIILLVSFISLFSNIIAESKTDIIEISNVDELSNAISNQKANQTWKIKEGTYDLTEKDLDKYKDWKNPGNSSQGNWYFPIYKDNITLIGEGEVTITSNVKTENGVWASQDFLSIWGNNITINNIDIKSKSIQNKAIEIMGKNFTLKNSIIKEVTYENSSNGKVFSGSIYFNPLNSEKDIGNCSLENVYIFAHISASQAQKGNLDALNLTLNFTNNVWSEWGEGYGPSLIGDVYGKTDNITYIIDNNAIWNELISFDYIYNEDTKPGTIIKLSEDIKLNNSLTITRNDIIIDLNSYKISASSNFPNLKDKQNHLIVLENTSNVIIKNGTVETNSNTKNGITITNSQGITLENMTINNKNTLSGGIPLSILNSNTNIKGSLELHVNDNHSHGINISSNNGNSSLNFENNSYISIKGKDTLTAINLDGSKEDITITGANNAGLEIGEDGNYIKHNHTFSDIWRYDENYHWKECICGEIVDKSEHVFTWIIDKESTTTSTGLKHEACSICGYKKDEVEIPIIGIISNENNKNIISVKEDVNYTNMNKGNNTDFNYSNNQIFTTEEENIISTNELFTENDGYTNISSNKLNFWIYLIITFIIILVFIINKNKAKIIEFIKKLKKFFKK